MLLRKVLVRRRWPVVRLSAATLIHATRSRCHPARAGPAP
jgi:hypothetical protein